MIDVMFILGHEHILSGAWRKGSDERSWGYKKFHYNRELRS